MAQLLLLRGAKQVLTLRGPTGARRGTALQDLGIVEDGSVLIREGRIAHVGPTRRIENLKEARRAVEIPVSGMVVMPGFVDAGIRLSQQVDDAAPLKRGKLSCLYNEVLTLLRACLQHGTLNAQARVLGQPGNTNWALQVLRQLARIGDNPVGMIRSWRPGSPATAESVQSLSVIRRRKLAYALELSLAEEHATRDGAMAELPSTLAAASSASGFTVNLALNARCNGGAGEILSQACARFRPGSIFCPPELGVAECAAIAKSSAVAVFSSTKELMEERYGTGACRVVDQGGAIALASSYDAKEAPIFSMQMVVALAVMRCKLTTEEAISAATINAAHAVGRGHEIGSLETGKRADVVVLNLPDYRELSRRFGLNHVGIVIRDGNLVINRNRSKASGV